MTTVETVPPDGCFQQEPMSALGPMRSFDAKGRPTALRRLPTSFGLARMGTIGRQQKSSRVRLLSTKMGWPGAYAAAMAAAGEQVSDQRN